MKRTNFIMKGFMALAVALTFTQCVSNNGEEATKAQAEQSNASSSLKIAFVEIDTLLTKYNFCIDMNEMMIKKEENIRTTLNEKGKKLEAEVREFERKINNNGFTSRERAEQEQARLLKLQQELQELQQKLTEELNAESQKNNLELRDSISSFLKVYNEEKGYDMIISNAGLDNLLFAKPQYNITREVVEGLNSRYSSKK